MKDFNYNSDELLNSCVVHPIRGTDVSIGRALDTLYSLGTIGNEFTGGYDGIDALCYHLDSGTCERAIKTLEKVLCTGESMKFYVQSGSIRMVLSASNPQEAAEKALCVYTKRHEGEEFEIAGNFIVSQIGFGATVIVENPKYPSDKNSKPYTVAANPDWNEFSSDIILKSAGMNGEYREDNFPFEE